MKRYKVTKFVFANNFASAVRKEPRTQPVEISLDEAVLPPDEKTPLIGFSIDTDEDDGRE